ncbi:hypothetical protein GLYMA_02G236550v4 [Glycine max]|nr:hypothetical protein GLYMA_02G236550v4 [Glycine max]
MAFAKRKIAVILFLFMVTAAIASNAASKRNTVYEFGPTVQGEYGNSSATMEISRASANGFPLPLLLPTVIFCVLVFFGSKFLVFGVPILFVLALVVAFLGLR